MYVSSYKIQVAYLLSSYMYVYEDMYVYHVEDTWFPVGAADGTLDEHLFYQVKHRERLCED
jgi:hypothetical protein